MAFTRGQLGTRNLRSRNVTVKLSKKRLPVGRSTDRIQSAVENNTTPRCESTRVLPVQEALPGVIDDPVTRPSTSSSLLLPAPQAPSLQPDQSGLIAHGDFREAANYLAPTACQDGVISVDEANVGIPKDGAWDQFAAFISRHCVNHGNEYLLGCYPRWMRPRDLHPSSEKMNELVTMLQGYQKDPFDFETLSSRFRADCPSTLWSQIDTPIAEGRCGDDVIYLIRWKLCWTLIENIDDLNWVMSSHKVQEGRIGRRGSKRLEATAGMRAEKTKAIAAAFKEIGELC